MSLPADQYARLKPLLENLETVRAKLDLRSRDFVDDQIKRFDQYDDQTRLSVKQWNWLESLHRQHCGHAPPLPELDEYDEDEGDGF